MNKTTVTVVIADDHPIFLEGLKAVLSRSASIEYRVVATAGTGVECLRALARFAPDVLILDLNMPEMDGLEVLEYLRKNNLEVNTLVLSMYDDPKIIKHAFKEGLDGYLVKQHVGRDLMVALDAILRGGTYVGAEGNGVGIEKPVNGRAFQDNFVQKFNLTKRELEILKLISQALSNKEIAKALFISDQTVGVHRKNIMRKLGVSNTAGLVRIAYDHSLV